MPFNFKENGAHRDSTRQGKPPVLYEPTETKRHVPVMLIAAFVLAGVAGIAYFIYQSGVLGEESVFQSATNQPPHTGLTTPPETLLLATPPNAPVDTSTGRSADSVVSHDVATSVDTPAVTPAPVVTTKREVHDSAVPAGEYTIFLARFKSKDLADEEVRKWNRAGEEVMITNQNGWYRISVGRFETRDSAKTVADKLAGSHKVQYFIGKLGN